MRLSFVKKKDVSIFNITDFKGGMVPTSGGCYRRAGDR